MADKPYVTIVVAIVGALATIGGAYFGAHHAAQEEIKPLQAQSAGSLADGQKLCSVWGAGAWRDSLIVPKEWSPDLCQAFATKVGAPQWTLGCVYKDRVNFGDPNGSSPSPDCGWR